MTRWIRMALLLSTLAPNAAFSMEVFQFVDSAGTVHFTNVPTDPRYRRLQSQQKALFYIGKDRRQKLDSVIEREAVKRGIEPSLIKSIIQAESDFNADAVSYAGAQGLMQLMPDTVAYLRLGDPFDPEENIRGGARHLRYLLNLFNSDLALTLAAYHAGARTVLKYGKIPPIEETRLYVEKVLRLYKRYSGKSVRFVYKGTGSDGALVYTNHPEQYPEIVFSRFKE